MTTDETTRRDIDTGDIQAIARSAFATLKAARYMLLRVTEADTARQWLRSLAPASVADLSMGRAEKICQIAFTAAGLRALGVSCDVVNRFSPEFVEGMAGNDNRSLRLGDIEANEPEKWNWGLRDREPHVLLMLFSAPDEIETFANWMLSDALAAGLSNVEVLSDSDMDDFEPFGFKDGVSQPSFDWDRPRTPGTKADQDYTNLIALGELLLGYRNEYGLLTERPWLKASEKNAGMLPNGAKDRHDLGRNGSYLIYRQLAQDVRGFWRWVADEAARCGIEKKEELAEAMVGRRLDGSPLADLILGRSIPGVSAHHEGNNAFVFDTDPEGLSCPIGAHVRRANPRTGDMPGGRKGPLDTLLTMLGLTVRRDRDPTSSTLPWPRNTTVWPFLRSEDDAIASTRFHRVLRRGREYGTRLDRDAALAPGAVDESERGIHFLCLNANIARQFEFVQGAWIASATFGALSGEQDPLLGNRAPFPAPPVADPGQRTDGFSRPSAPPNCRHASGLPQFVQVRGGAYFFLPGLTALKWITSD
jgi:deferrochelatase/peroxidase EfeB